MRLGVLLFVLVVAGGIFLASKFVPPYWAYLSLKDPVKEAALALVSRQEDEGKVRAGILQRAGELGLPLTDDNIEITQEGSAQILRVTWTVPIDLPRYHYTLHFRLEERTPLP